MGKFGLGMLLGCQPQGSTISPDSQPTDATAPVSVTSKSGEGAPSGGDAGDSDPNPIPSNPTDPTEPAQLLFTSYPETFTLARAGQIAFQATEGVGKDSMSFACSWDSAPFADCESPSAFAFSSAGAHSLKIEMRRPDGSVADLGSRSFFIGPQLKEHKALTAYLSNTTLFVRGVITDDEGNIFIATSKGLLVYLKGATSAVLRTVVQGSSLLNNIFAMSRDPMGRIFVGTGAGYAVTSDQGVTWTTRGVSDGLPHSTVSTAAFDQVTGKTYLGTYGGVVSTTDGTTFQPVSLAGGPASGVAQIHFFKDGRVIVSNTANRLYVSSSINGGFSQVPGMSTSSTFKVAPDELVYVYGSSGIYVSSDRGATFAASPITTAQGLLSNDVRGVMVTPDGVIYAATSSLVVSYDGGQSFTAVTTPSTLPAGTLLRMHAIDDQGRLLLVGNNFVALSDESFMPVVANEDHDPPKVEAATLSMTSSGRAGVGVEWNLAHDDHTEDRAVRYLLFKSNSSSLTHVGEVFRNATQVDATRQGVKNAAVYLNSGTSTYLYLVALDTAGNAFLYQPLQVSSNTAQARSLAFTQVTADAGLGAPIDHAVVAKGPWVFHIGGVSLVGGVSILNQVAMSSDQAAWTTIPQNGSQEAERYGHTATLFNNQIMVIGGMKSDLFMRNDVVATGLGSSWTSLTSNAGFAPRLDHATLAHNGRLWVIGGQGTVNGTATVFNDVWSSADGATWQRETGSAAFPARSAHTALSFGGRMWILGGSDVWYSDNGREWYQAAANLPMGGFSNAASVVYQNRMWILGGHGANGFVGVWSSSDGSYWEEASTNNTFPGREWHAALVASDGKIYFYNGNKYGYQTDVWRGE